MRINHKVASEISNFVSIVGQLGEIPKEKVTFTSEEVTIPGDDVKNFNAIVSLGDLNLSQDALRVIEKLGVSRGVVQGQSQFVLHSNHITLPHQHRYLGGREKVAEEPAKVLSAVAYNLRILKQEADLACGQKATVSTLAKKLDVRLVIDRSVGNPIEATVEVASSKQAFSFMKESGVATVNALDNSGQLRKLLISPSSMVIGHGSASISFNKGDLLDTSTLGKADLKVIPYAEFEKDFKLCSSKGLPFKQPNLNALYHMVPGLSIGRKTARVFLKSIAAYSTLNNDQDFKQSASGKSNIIGKALSRLQSDSFTLLIRRPINLDVHVQNLDKEEASVVKAAKWLQTRSQITKDVHPLVHQAENHKPKEGNIHDTMHQPKTLQQLRL